MEERCLWILGKVRDRELIVKKIGTEENRGDMQTKALDPGRFWQLVDALPFDFAPGCSQSTGTTSSSGTPVTAIGSRGHGALATVVLAGNFSPSAAVRSSGDESPQEELVYTSTAFQLQVITAFIFGISVGLLCAQLLRPKAFRCTACQTEPVSIVPYRTWSLAEIRVEGISEASRARGVRPATAWRHSCCGTT